MANNNNIQEKAVVPDNVLDRSVQAQVDHQTIPGNDSFVMEIATIADDIIPWGRNVAQRDRQLRKFWPNEPYVASAINTIVAARANMSWSLDGAPRTVGIVQRMLQSSNLGKGWLDLQSKVAMDLLSQDNGGFAEIIRQADAPNSPVLNLNHLDAGRCVRTGMQDFPVIYYDRQNVEHKLAWYQVMTFEDMSSPIEEMNGVQYCFLTRVLRGAQILRDISVFKREKLSGRNPGQIYLVSGVQTKLVDDKMAVAQEHATNQGFARYMMPVVLGSLDPNANVNAVTLDFKSLPDGFDEDTTMRWYISLLAMGAGADYQDFAPLASGSLGSASQSETLHRKSRGKGHFTWKKLWEHKLNFSGIMPQSITFSFDENDIEIQSEEAELDRIKAQTFSTYYDKGTGVLPLNVIHQMMADDGILKPEYLAMLGEQDVTTDIVATDDTPAATQSEIDDANQTAVIVNNDTDETATQTIQGELKKKQIDDDVAEYQDILQELAEDALNGRISQAEFLDEAGILVAQQALLAFLEGSEKTIAQLTDDDREVIDEQTDVQLDALPQFYNDILGFEGNDNPEKNIENRVRLWGTTALGIFAIGILHGINESQLIGWRLGETDHCPACLNLSTVIATRAEWRESGWHPKSRRLDCHGYNCECRFFDVNEGESAGSFP